jgi:nitrite reductase/ring-hydroxylating ferredoxin subunit
MATPIPERETISLPPDGRPLDQQPAWRQDFPIDWPQDSYIERRDFVKFLTLTSLAFAVGQLWIAGKSWMRSRELPPGAKRIASTRDLAVGASIVFDYPAQHDSCILVRIAEAEYVAFGQKCTHLSCAVIPRPDQGVFHCPCHEGLFDLRSGRVLAGPPPRPLPKIRLQIEGDEIFATGVEGGTV